MGGLPEAKFAIVRTLVEQAPDGVVGNLRQALASVGSDSALSEVRRLVEDEAADRRLRDAVLAPLAPLFGEGPEAPRRLSLPQAALQPLWRSLKAAAPREVAVAARRLDDYEPDEGAPEFLDQLTARIARDLQDEHPAFSGAVEALRQGGVDGVEVLSSCLALSPIVRSAMPRLAAWIWHGADERAAARVAYADAASIAPDAGPRFFEMLSAHLQDPWRVLRIVSVVMDRPSEAYLAGSEFAVFAERLMDMVDGALRRISEFDPAGGPAVGRAHGKVVEQATLQISEIEGAVELLAEGCWGARVRKQRSALAAIVERRLREIERAMAAALPEHPVRVARAMRNMPRMTTDADPSAVETALCLLTFAEEIRTSANYGGFAAARARTVEKAGAVLDNYVEEVLDMLKHGEIEDRDRARAYLDVAGRCAALIHEPRAQNIIERRTAAAFGMRRPPELEEVGEVREL